MVLPESKVCRFAPVLFGAEPNAFTSLLLRPQLSSVDPLLVLPGVYSPYSSPVHRPDTVAVGSYVSSGQMPFWILLHAFLDPSVDHGNRSHHAKTVFLDTSCWNCTKCCNMKILAQDNVEWSTHINTNLALSKAHFSCCILQCLAGLRRCDTWNMLFGTRLSCTAKVKVAVMWKFEQVLSAQEADSADTLKLKRILQKSEGILMSTYWMTCHCRKPVAWQPCHSGWWHRTCSAAMRYLAQSGWKEQLVGRTCYCKICWVTMLAYVGF